MQVNLNKNSNSMEGVKTFCELILINLCSFGAFRLYAFVTAGPVIDKIYQANQFFYTVKPVIDALYILSLIMVNCIIIYYKLNKAKKKEE